MAFFRENMNPIAKLNLSTTQLAALSFALAAFLGGTLLSMPFSAEPGKTVSFLDGLFLATSAICVTGLATIDPGSNLSIIGELILLVLIQLGGLGIITAATLLVMGVGRRLSVSDRLNVSTAYGNTVGSASTLLRSIILTVFGIEAIGFVLLWILLAPTEPNAAYFAFFHTISAFNNAGFSLYPDSLVRFQTNFAVTGVIGGLIIIGGLGFTVILNLFQSWRERDRYHITLTTRMIIMTSGGLWVLGTVLYALFEWSNPKTIGGLEWWQKLLASIFLSVTPRTAGFNTIDYSLIQHNTVLLTLLMMFVGASPTSTAGGIKNTTFYVLLVSVWSFLRTGGDIQTLGRKLEFSTVMQSLAIFFLASMVVGVAVVGLAYTEAKQPLDVLVFEAISAFGTVGLSMNLTPLLSDAGKVIVICLMFVGRVGPITLGSALLERRDKPTLRYPSEGVTVG
jgi:trk system potassium uptake protein